MERQFTATVYIFHENKALLHYHAKLNKWLPPGGHLEPNETPPEAARREVKEETGLDIVFIEQENLKIEAYNATSFERPFLCLLERISPHLDKPAHEHMDLIYLARPKAATSTGEVGGFRWFAQSEIAEIEKDLFPDTKKMLELLFSTTFDDVFPALPSHTSLNPYIV